MSDMIQQAVNLSVQSQPGNVVGGGVFPVIWLARAGLQMPPWWSPARDIELRSFWKKIDHLAGTIYTVEAKMTAIPFRVLARDPSISAHVAQASEYTQLMYQSPQFGEGWSSFYARFIEDYLSQDNGAFAEIIGQGAKDGPIIGAPITIAHLDASRCQRTGNAEFPVVYQDVSGKWYKLHYTRVLYAAQMGSPAVEMFGVGVCSVSRCVNVAQTLLDILTFKQEKLGSRPHRVVLITKGGLDPNDLKSAFELAEGNMDSQNLSRYSKTVVVGSSSIQDAAVDKVELSSLPDGFNEEMSITLGMATIALAFGMDARELFPAMQSGATRAEALLQHLKQRGKGPGQIIQMTEMLFNQKFLPAHLEMIFDFQDDAQDRQAADTKKVRADKRLQDMNTGAMNTRIMREQMVESGDLSQSQFERLELTDGRLSDGTIIFSLFYTADPYLKKFLDVGTDDPLDFAGNDAMAMDEIIHEKLIDVSSEMAKERNPLKRYKLIQALSALVFLKRYYLDPIATFEKAAGFELVVAMNQPQGAESPDGRVRNVNLAEPTPGEEETNVIEDKRNTEPQDQDNKPE